MVRDYHFKIPGQHTSTPQENGSVGQTKKRTREDELISPAHRKTWPNPPLGAHGSSSSEHTSLNPAKENFNVSQKRTTTRPSRKDVLDVLESPEHRNPWLSPPLGAHGSTSSSHPPSQSPNNPRGASTTAHHTRGQEAQSKIPKPSPARENMTGKKRSPTLPPPHTHTPRRSRGNLMVGALSSEGILSRGDKPPYSPSGCP